MATKATKVQASKPTTVTIPFTFEKETPNTFRFKEDGTGPDSRGLIGTIYVHKATFNSQPKRISVTISVVE